MKNVKALLKWIPEIYLMASIIYYWIDTGLFNPFAIAFFLSLSLLLYFKSKVMGIVVSSLFILINMYMVLALLSEFNEFPTFDHSAKNLLFFGLIYIGLNLTMGIIMFIKYVKSDKQSALQMTV